MERRGVLDQYYQHRNLCGVSSILHPLIDLIFTGTQSTKTEIKPVSSHASIITTDESEKDEINPTRSTNLEGNDSVRIHSPMMGMYCYGRKESRIKSDRLLYEL